MLQFIGRASVLIRTDFILATAINLSTVNISSIFITQFHIINQIYGNLTILYVAVI